MESRSGVVLIIGLPGTGKTTLANRLSRLLQWEVVSTEVVRAQLFGEKIVLEDRDFSPEELNGTYAEVCRIVDMILQRGGGVIVDGVFRSHLQRQQVIDVVSKHDTPWLGILTRCDEQTVIERLRLRKKMGSISPGGEIAYSRLKHEFDPVDESFLKIDTGNHRE